MPFLRDEGPPVSAATIQSARETLPLEFGTKVVNETGREVLLVRVPKAKPDYLNDLAEVAFYVSLETIRNANDILLIGHEKTARLEPQRLRDHIRAQQREDAGVVDGIRRSVDKNYGFTFIQSPSNFKHSALAMRLPKETVTDFTPDDVRRLREVLEGAKTRVEQTQYAYIVANRDYERLGKRILMELAGLAQQAPPESTLTIAAPPAPLQAPPAPRNVMFPATPGVKAPAASIPTAFPSMAPPGAFQINSLMRGPNVPVPPTPVAAPTPVTTFAPPPTAAPPVVENRGGFDIISKPVGVPASAPLDAPIEKQFHDTAGLRSGLSVTNVTEEYEVVSKPKAPEAPKPAPHKLGLAVSGDAEAQVHEEYEIVSKAKPAEAPKPAAAPHRLGLNVAADAQVDEHEEYEIVSKPKAEAPKPVATVNKLGLNVGNDAEAKVEDEYEIVTKKAPAAEAAPQPELAPEPEKHVLHHDKEFEVFTSKPKPRHDAGAASVNLSGPLIPTQPFSAKTKEYEIMDGGSSLPSPTGKIPMGHAPSATPPAPVSGFTHGFGFAATPAGSGVPMPTSAASETTHPKVFQGVPGAAAPGSVINLAALGIHAPPPSPTPAPVIDDPRAITPKIAAPTAAVADSGTTVIPTVALALPEKILGARFQENGYEIVEGLKAQGTIFAFAAHKPQGRRVLVKRAETFGVDEAVPLAQLVTALGADVCIVVADTVRPGARLASWGTRLEIVSAADVQGLTL